MAVADRVDALSMRLITSAWAPIGVLQARSTAGRDAQLKIATVKLQLSELQTAPFQAHKPGTLDAEECEFMRGHTLTGERIVRAAPSLAHTADLIRSSHERFDGAGYPDGLAGDEIPLGASIIAVCDAYDAMVTDRPYRRALTVANALAELRRCSGSQFDPAVTAAFCALAEAREGAAPLTA
jgi:hypothetical protein